MGKCLTAAIIALTLVSCPSEPQPDLLAKADAMLLEIGADAEGNEEKFREVIDVLRRFLMQNPHHPGGHFLLGRTHLRLNNLVVAEGEFRTALYWFEQRGKENPIPRFSGAEYFEIICHVGIAKAHFVQFLYLRDLGASKAALRNRYEGLKEVLAKVKSIDPDQPDVQNFENILEIMEEVLAQYPERKPNPDAPDVVPLEV